MSAHNETHATEEKPMHWAKRYLLGLPLLLAVGILGCVWGGGLPFASNMSYLNFEWQRTIRNLCVAAGFIAIAVILLLDDKKLRMAGIVMIALGFVLANTRM